MWRISPAEVSQEIACNNTDDGYQYHCVAVMKHLKSV
jgi:hypothetical protein